MASYANELQTYRRFLDNFCQQLKTKKEADETSKATASPVKLCYQYVIQSEVEGECLEWARQYLISYCCCPSGLAALIARYTCDEILKKELSHLYVISDNSHPQAIDAHELLKEVISKVQDVCLHLQGTLPRFKVPERSYKVSASAIKNRRRKMEDRHIILPDINNLFALKGYPNQSYYAIYDGHSGVEAAVYAVTHLHCNLVRSQYFATDVHQALKSSYEVTDKCFLEKCARESLKSGTTGINALIRGSTVYIGWLGDSQAVLVRNGQVINLTKPHTPEREDEKQRIEELGGIVLLVNGISRVNGNISVSRAIGDASQKPCISSDADVVSFELDGSEDYLVLACDGAWDCICKENLPHIVYDHVQKNNGQCSTVADLLVKFASENGSTDNISVIVVFFKDVLPDPELGLHEVIRENGENKKRDHNPNSNSDGDGSSSSQSRNSGDMNSGFRKPEKASKLCGSEKLIPLFGGGQPCEIKTPVPTSCQTSKETLLSNEAWSILNSQQRNYPPSISKCSKFEGGEDNNVRAMLKSWFLLEGLQHHWTQLDGQCLSDRSICGQLTCVCLQNFYKAILSSLLSLQVFYAPGRNSCDVKNAHWSEPNVWSRQKSQIRYASDLLPLSLSSLDSLFTSNSTSTLVPDLSNMPRAHPNNSFPLSGLLCSGFPFLSTANPSVMCPKVTACPEALPTRYLLHHPDCATTSFASSFLTRVPGSTCPVVFSATS